MGVCAAGDLALIYSASDLLCSPTLPLSLTHTPILMCVSSDVHAHTICTARVHRETQSMHSHALTPCLHTHAPHTHTALMRGMDARSTTHNTRARAPARTHTLNRTTHALSRYSTHTHAQQSLASSGDGTCACMQHSYTHTRARKQAHSLTRTLNCTPLSHAQGLPPSLPHSS